MVPLKILVCYLHWGPYHEARAHALLEMEGIDPCFLELAPWQKDHPWLGGRKREIPVETLWPGPLDSVPRRAGIRRMRHALERISPDVVVTCGYGDPVLRAAASWAIRTCRGSVLLHETTRADRPRWLLKEIVKGILIRRLYHTALVSGKPHREYLEELGVHSERIEEPATVVDNRFFQSAASEIRRDDDSWRKRLKVPQNYFLYIGRFAEEKNLESLLHAYHMYRRRMGGLWGLVLVGDGPKMGRLTALAKRLGLTDVVFPGYRPTADLPPYYALASCFVLPSLIEPWGLVVNEAMACGLPVLLSRSCGCLRDLLLEGQNGFSFSPHDVGELADRFSQMEQLDSARRAEMGKASAPILASYTPQRWAEALARCARAAAERCGIRG